MISSDYRKFVFFMLTTVCLFFVSLLLSVFCLEWIIGNELGDIYWGIILPIFFFFIIAILLFAVALYGASWIYFVKTKGFSRWLGLWGFLPIFGPLFLIFKKENVPQGKEKNFSVLIALIGMVIPFVVFFSFYLSLKNLTEKIEDLNKNNYSSTSKINAVVKGIHHEKENN